MKRRDDYEISTDQARLDVAMILAFLRDAYWSPGIPREVIERAIQHSIAFGIYGRDGTQVGFARVISDRATFAYMADVFILEGYRSRGLGTWLVQSILEYPALQGLRRWALATADAGGLYERFGFRRPETDIHLFRELPPEQLWASGQAETAITQ